jgi:hypothetical protein
MLRLKRDKQTAYIVIGRKFGLVEMCKPNIIETEYKFYECYHLENTETHEFLEDVDISEIIPL